MNKFLKIALIITFFLGINSKGAYSAILTQEYISQKVKNNYTSYLKESISGDISVTVKSLPYKNIEVPDGKVEILTDINSKYFSSLTVIKVRVLVNGKNIKSFGVPVKVSVKDKVWIVKQYLKRGDSVTFSNIALEKRDITNHIKKALTKEKYPFNKIVNKNFKPGDILDKRFIDTPPVVSRNSMVLVVFKSEKLTVAIDGEALEDGKIGDYIKVRNKKYKKRYTGKVVSANKVIVEI